MLEMMNLSLIGYFMEKDVTSFFKILFIEMCIILAVDLVRRLFFITEETEELEEESSSSSNE